MSFADEIRWAIIGLFLTVGSTFLEAFVTNPPWQWLDRGILPQSLGVTYQVGAVLLIGCLGGKNAAAISQIAYLLLGLTWSDWFYQGGGWSYLEKPVFGYLIGFVPGAWLCGWLAFRNKTKLESLALSSLAGLLVIHLCGIIYLSFMSDRASFWTGISQYSLSQLPGQLVLVCLVAVVAYILRLVLLYK